MKAIRISEHLTIRVFLDSKLPNEPIGDSDEFLSKIEGVDSQQLLDRGADWCYSHLMVSKERTSLTLHFQKVGA